MRINIDDKDLELLIEKKRDYIGAKEWGTFGVVDSVLLILSTYTARYEGLFVPSRIIKALFYLFAIIQLGIAVVQIHKRIFCNYTKKDLLKNIRELHMIERSSSIIAIKNSRRPERLLVYDDKDWAVQFFPNYRTVTGDNAGNLKRRLAEDLKLNEKEIELHFCHSGEEQKFSTEHNEERLYHYEFYKATLSEKEDERDFSVNGKRYHWRSIEDLLGDEKVKKHNRFVVEQIRDYVM